MYALADAVSPRFRALVLSQPVEIVSAIEDHLHDLRHGAGTLAAATGTRTKELMRRLGHATPRAALRYQHATEDGVVPLRDRRAQ